MRLRFVVISLAFAIACAASASYELLLVPEAATGKIHRIDPTTGAMLGSFGGSALTPSQVQADRTTGTAWINGGQWGRFDYSTGERAYLGNGVSSVQLVRDPSTGYLWTMSGGQVARMTENGAYTGTTFNGFASGASNAWSFSILPGNRALTVCGGSGMLLLKVLDLTTGAQVANSAPSVPISFASFVLGQTCTITRNSFTFSFFSYKDSNDTRRTFRVTTNAAGQVTQTWSASASGFAGGSVSVAAVPSHSGFYLVGPDATSGTRIQDYGVDDAGNPFLVNSYSVNVNMSSNSWTSVATVIAPEPASLAALGLGALALVRRRKGR